MTESLFTAWVDVRANTAGFEESVRSSINAAGAGAPAIPIKANTEGLTAQVDRAAVASGASAGEKFGATFHEHFSRTIQTALTFGVGYLGFAGVTDFLKIGIEQTERWDLAVNNLKNTYGALAPHVQAAAEAQAHALGFTQTQNDIFTAQFGALAQSALKQTPGQSADTAATLDRITAQIVTKAGGELDAQSVQTMVLQFLATGQGRGLAKYIGGKVDPTDVQQKALELGLIKPEAADADKVNASTLAIANAKAKLFKDENDPKSHATRLQIIDDNQHIKSLMDAQSDLLTKVTLPALNDQQKAAAGLVILQERAVALPDPAPTATTRIKNAIDDIARVATGSSAPLLDQFATFLEQHGDQIGNDIGGSFDKMGQALGFAVDHKAAFLEIAGAFAFLHEKGASDSIFNQFLRATGHGAAGGGAAGGVLSRVATMNVEAGVVNVVGGRVGGGGGVIAGGGKGGAAGEVGAETVAADVVGAGLGAKILGKAFPALAAVGLLNQFTELSHFGNNQATIPGLSDILGPVPDLTHPVGAGGDFGPGEQERLVNAAYLSSLKIPFLLRGANTPDAATLPSQIPFVNALEGGRSGQSPTLEGRIAQAQGVRGPLDGGGSLIVNVNGITDPAAVAQAVASLLAGHGLFNQLGTSPPVSAPPQFRPRSITSRAGGPS